jgi:hypothetical protein
MHIVTVLANLDTDEIHFLHNTPYTPCSACLLSPATTTHSGALPDFVSFLVFFKEFTKVSN